MHQNAMIEAVQSSLLNQLWYLTEELVVFALFDADVKEDKRHSMAVKLLSIPVPEYFGGSKTRFPVELMDKEPKLDSFIRQRSQLVFSKLDADGHSWLLAKDVNNWENDAEYTRMERCLKELTL